VGGEADYGVRRLVAGDEKTMNTHNWANTPDDDASPSEASGLPWGLIGQIALVLLAIGVSGFALYECAQIGAYKIRYRNELYGQPLPLATQWVLDYRTAFIATVFFVPCAAAATFALRERWQAIGALVLLITAGVLDGLFVRLALPLPFVVFIKQMGHG